jgi:uncharacterized secreted protein with C-terminal beta-propeller domain
MKKVLVLLTFLSVTTIIVACSNNAEAHSVNDTFIEVSEDGMFTEYKHKETGCHYIYMNSSQSENLVQMFIEENGVSVPYCDNK